VAEDAELIVIWGSNTKVTNMHFWPYVAAAGKKGGRLVVIDPYRNITAQSADLHLQVEPGGDSALALGVLKALIEKGHIDRDSIDSSCSGFGEIDTYLRQTPWDGFVEQSGLPRDAIEMFAGMLHNSPRTFFRLGIGLTRNSRAGMSVRAICSLAAALGIFDGGSGRGVLLTTNAFKGDREKLTWSALAKKPARACNMVQLGSCLQAADPPVKMLFVYNANPLSVTPDSSLVRRALEKEDLFTVVHEQVMTPTAKYADLLLPATTFLENKDIYTGYGHFYMSVAEAVIAPLGEAKSNFDFFQELAQKLGYAEVPFRQSLEERMADYLHTLQGLPGGMTLDDIVAEGVVHSSRCNRGRSFFTSGNRFSFTYSDDPALPGFACLLAGGEFDDPDYQARFPLKMIAPPHMDLLNSTFGERYEGHPGEVLIHPADALAYAVTDGAMVTLLNNRGRTQRIARVTDATRRGLVVAEGIFWQTGEQPSAINDLTSQKLTDMGGGGTFHESRVAIVANEGDS
jgi:anaerobic selenocysteine-containing dehydrogenase